MRKMIQWLRSLGRSRSASVPNLVLSALPAGSPWPSGTARMGLQFSHAKEQAANGQWIDLPAFYPAKVSGMAADGQIVDEYIGPFPYPTKVRMEADRVRIKVRAWRGFDLGEGNG